MCNCFTVPPPIVTITSTPITTSYYAGAPLYLTCTVQLIPQVDTPTIVTWLRGLSIITIDNYTTVSPLIRNGYSPISPHYSLTLLVLLTVGSTNVTALFNLGFPMSSQKTSCSQCHHHSFSISTSLGVAYTLTCQPLVVAGLVLSLDLMWSRADSLSLGTTPVTNGSTITLSSTSWSAQNHAEYNCTAIVLLPLKGILVSSTASIFLKDTHTLMMSWSPPLKTNGLLTGYILSIVQLLDYDKPVIGSAKNATIDVMVT
ncbi:hypothetical protein EMCRGX_G028060 [Ephydatia muelleri]